MTAEKEKPALFVTDKIDVEIKVDGKSYTFYAHEIGYLESQNIALEAAQKHKNGLAMMVAACIRDAEGNKFTYDEVLSMKRTVAKPLFDAVVKINSAGESESDGEEKN